MKMLKNMKNKHIDKKFKEIGFKKSDENKYSVIYKRYNNEYEYTHIIHLMHKQNGKHIVQSYDEKVFIGLEGNIGIGLTVQEMKLCLRKMKALGWNFKNNFKKENSVL